MRQVLVVSGRVNLTRSASDDLIVQMLITRPFVVAHWRGGEPIVDGYGLTPWAARNSARLSGAPTDAEMCTRIPGELMVWQGPSSRRVTVEDLLTVDD